MPREGDLLTNPSRDFEEIIIEVSSSQPIKTMVDLERVVNSIVASVPKINKTALRREMENMNVKLSGNPTTKDLNEGLALAQSYKDRLAEIYTVALREFKTLERCVDMLCNAFIATEANGKNSEARQGQAGMRYVAIIWQLQSAENFLKEVEHVLNNIKSAHESVSRQVSIAQIQLQLGEIRRGANFSEAEEVRPKNSDVDWESFN